MQEEHFSAVTWWVPHVAGKGSLGGNGQEGLLVSKGKRGKDGNNPHYRKAPSRISITFPVIPLQPLLLLGPE